MKSIFLLGSHSWLSDGIDLSGFDSDVIGELYDWAERKGDLLSKVSAFEVGVKHLTRFPGIAAQLLSIAEQLTDEEDHYEAFTSFFIMVYGQISQFDFARNSSPFWLRCSALAHAAVIERASITTDFWDPKLRDWIYSKFGQLFIARVYSDMRKEPRWNPNLASSTQIRSEFIGRMMDAVSRQGKGGVSDEIYAYFFETDNPVFRDVSMGVPGPLEGNIRPDSEIPQTHMEELESLLKEEKVDITVLIGLINTALFFA